MFDPARSVSPSFRGLEWFDFELRSLESCPDWSLSVWQKSENTEEWNDENQLK